MVCHVYRLTPSSYEATTGRNLAVTSASKYEVGRRKIGMFLSPVEFRGSLNESTYVRALRLAGASPLLLGYILVGGGIAAAFAYSKLDRPISWSVPLLMLLLGAYVLFAPTLTARRALRTGSILRTPFSGHADESAFVTESVHGRATLPWETFYRAALSSDMILLHTSAQLFRILSRDFFASEDDWTRLSELVRAKVPIKRPGRQAFKVGILWFVIVVLTFVAWSLWRSLGAI